MNLLVLEIVIRLYLMATYNVKFFNPNAIIYFYYPELKTVRDSLSNKGDNSFDILLAGGSALHPNWGHIQYFLERELIDVRIHNIAQPAHSSLDSFTKLKQLGKLNIDLIIFYQGINEVRMNNIPKQYFRENYSHYLWHRKIQILLNHKEINLTTIPYMLNYTFMYLKNLVGFEKYIKSDIPNPKWIKHGKELKTPEVYKKNVSNILSIAQKNDISILFITFAVYLAEKYSISDFLNGRLDYNLGVYKCPVEIWGEPNNVISGVEKHNEVLENLFQESNYKKLFFYDMSRQLTKKGTHFEDICHLTKRGSKEFAFHLKPILDSIISNAKNPAF